MFMVPWFRLRHASSLSGRFPLFSLVRVHKPWNMALDKGIRDPNPRVTSIKGTNLKSLTLVPRLEGLAPNMALNAFRKAVGPRVCIKGTWGVP